MLLKEENASYTSYLMNTIFARKLFLSLASVAATIFLYFSPPFPTSVAPQSLSQSYNALIRLEEYART